MKKLISTLMLGFLVTAGTFLKAQNQTDEYLGLPGDNLNLYAVMNLFQESQTLEEFERRLNDPDSRINNLDLNGDNLVDYIMVNDYVKRNDHTIVLQVALNNNERQDVGVFTVEKLRNGAVQVQLVGDEALYGSNYIIEPNYDDGETLNPGYTGRNNVTYVRTTYYEVGAWPVIRFIYDPYYTVWHSSWYWGYYPTYWNPWRPYYYHYYYGYHHNHYPVYYSHYHHAHHNRYNHYHDYYYTNVRSHSPYVSHRIKEGHYKTTYSRPESRRDGEAMYARTHNESRSSTVSNNTINNRRSTYNESRTADRSGSTATRRTGTTTYSGDNKTRSNRSINERRSINNEKQATSSRTRNVSHKDAAPKAGEKKSQSSVRTNSSINTRTAMKSPEKPSSASNRTMTNPQRNSAPGRTESASRSSRTSTVSNNNAARSQRQTTTAAQKNTNRSEPAREARQSGTSSTSSKNSTSGKSDRTNHSDKNSNDHKRPAR